MDRKIVWFEGTSDRIAGFLNDHISNITTQIDAVRYPGTEFEVRAYDVGIPAFDPCYEHIWLNKILKEVVEAEKAGCDAVVMGCIRDAGVRYARELVSIPVVGPGEATMHLAAMLGHKFSIIAASRKDIPVLLDNARIYGVDSKIASWSILGVPFSEMQDREKIKHYAVREAQKALEKNGAEVIVLACTLLSGISSEVQSIVEAPVLDPIITGFKVAEMLADLKRKTGLSHSKKYGYQTPKA